MGDPLYVNTEGVLGMARVHDAVAAGLGQLQHGGGLGQSAGPATTHGLIAFGMNSALGGVMARRDNILQSTGAAGQQMSEQLHRATEAYRAGDEQGAQGLSAAAERLPGSGGGGGVGAGTPGGLGASVPGSPAAGGDVAQTLGQVGQQAGQIAQGVAQTLGQIPGQLAQSVTGVLGGLLGGLGGVDGAGAGHAAGAGLGGLNDPPGGVGSVGEHDKSDPDDRDRDRRDPERHEKGEDDNRILTVEHRGESGAAGADPAAGPSDVAAPPPRRPAQTRPQDI